MSKKNGIVVEKKICPRIEKSCTLSEAWDSIGDIVASRFGGQEFLPVPHLLDANVYGIGNVFVPVITKTGCFGSSSTLRIIGPIKKFVVRSVTNPKWYESDFPVVVKPREHKNFQVKLGNGDREIVFKAIDSNYLIKPENMISTKDVTIDRSSHEDLTNAKMIGLISEVVASNVFQIDITVKLRARTFYVGDNGSHTLLFKYEIYKLDEIGKIRRVITDTKELKSMKWEPVNGIKRDKLPMSSLN